ncbi:hypothetical protein P7K49_033597 [Saguinus oedipus]|uniref:Uncharacterized protein n=1 Tax=Saguinus oedipus TaxID=9490 RepID=A0ABQ9TT64_SAGOE|nr:hypothetical protein P7K49_033597 [Saguinus oedipus]
MEQKTGTKEAGEGGELGCYNLMELRQATVGGYGQVLREDGDHRMAPGFQTHRGSPQKSPPPRFWLSSCPWEGLRGPGRHLSSASVQLLPDLMPAPADPTAREGLAAPPRRLRSRKVSCPLTRSNGDLVVSFPEPLPTGLFGPQHWPGTALLLIPDRTRYVRAGLGPALGLSLTFCGSGVSRGPSPVVLGSQDALPVATAFTEYVHAYFRGHSPRYTAGTKEEEVGGKDMGHPQGHPRSEGSGSHRQQWNQEQGEDETPGRARSQNPVPLPSPAAWLE